MKKINEVHIFKILNEMEQRAIWSNIHWYLQAAAITNQSPQNWLYGAYQTLITIFSTKSDPNSFQIDFLLYWLVI